MSDTVSEHPRRRGGDSLLGQVWALRYIIAACCVFYATWDGLKTKSAEHTTRIEKVEGDVDVLKQTMAAQTAILSRVESTVRSIDRGIHRRASDPDPIP